jgi:ABC-type transport system involved in multi-copper enzyme maturation permease subunit
MIWWKEWRETRFGFLTALFFMSGLYASMPMGRMSNEDYWIGMFLTFFAMTIAIVMGSGAFAPEVGSETIKFVLSKPVGKVKYMTAKYVVRGGEVLSLIAIPLGFMTTLRDWEGHSGWMWCAPYLLAQDIGFVLGLVALTFSGAFFFSVLFRKQALSALAGIILLTAYLAWRGIGGFRKIYGFETLEADTLILVFLIAGMFFGSLFAFRVREF